LQPPCCGAEAYRHITRETAAKLAKQTFSLIGRPARRIAAYIAKFSATRYQMQPWRLRGANGEMAPRLL